MPVHWDRSIIRKDGARTVPTSVWLHVDQWLGSPPWLREGTSLSPDEPLPPDVTPADDLRIAANILKHADVGELAVRALRHPVPLFGPRAAIYYSAAPTLSDALANCARSFNANHPSIRATFDRSGDPAIFRSTSLHSSAELGDFLAMLELVSIYQVINVLAPEATMGLSMRLTQPRPSSSADVRQTLGCHVEFGASENMISIPARWLDLPNPTHDSQLWLLGQQLAEQREHASASAQVARIREVVADFLDKRHQAPRLKQVAQAAGVSERTINRLLADEGTTFRDIVNDERKVRAASLINEPHLDLKEVARRLGFANTSSFGRSFRGWFGQPPGQFARTPRG